MHPHSVPHSEQEERQAQRPLRLALVTSADLPNLFGGEQLLPPALSALGAQVSICIWTDPSVQWQSFDAVIIRCPWDYHEKLPDFLSWLNRLRELKVSVINDLDTLMWNLNKKYLFELSQKHLPVIPSLCVTPDNQRSLAELMKQLDSKQIVVKPVQSAGAWRTLRVSLDNMLEVDREFSIWRQEQDFLVQPFMPEIMSEGEWSLIFFGGKFSHALLKRAKAGDFRVQSDHGGTVHAVDVSVDIQAQAQAILNTLERMPCYARVDGVLRDGQFMLMELELLEPELFLELDAEAPHRFARAIMHTLSAS
jgi:glutathione synthase/RimK-type ligase-like ATP-grasp enzyme